MKYLKTFEELSDNDYRNDDPISKLKMIELVYDTLMDNGGDTISQHKVTDQELDMESAEISFKYMGVPFRLIIEREQEKVQEDVGGGVACATATDSPTLPRKSTVKKIKKLGKKSGEHKSTKSSGGKNALTGKIDSYK